MTRCRSGWVATSVGYDLGGRSILAIAPIGVPDSLRAQALSRSRTLPSMRRADQRPDPSIPAYQSVRAHRRRHPDRRLLHQGLQPLACPAHRREPARGTPDPRANPRAALAAITRHVDDLCRPGARSPRGVNLTQTSTSSRPKIVRPKILQRERPSVMICVKGGEYGDASGRRTSPSFMSRH